jgi:hypothetical protein
MYLGIIMQSRSFLDSHYHEMIISVLLTRWECYAAVVKDYTPYEATFRPPRCVLHLLQPNSKKRCCRGAKVDLEHSQNFISVAYSKPVGSRK